MREANSLWCVCAAHAHATAVGEAMDCPWSVGKRLGSLGHVATRGGLTLGKRQTTAHQLSSFQVDAVFRSLQQEPNRYGRWQMVTFAWSPTGVFIHVQQPI